MDKTTPVRRGHHSYWELRLCRAGKFHQADRGLGPVRSGLYAPEDSYGPGRLANLVDHDSVRQEGRRVYGLSSEPNCFSVAYGRILPNVGDAFLANRPDLPLHHSAPPWSLS